MLADNAISSLHGSFIGRLSRFFQKTTFRIACIALSLPLIQCNRSHEPHETTTPVTTASEHEEEFAREPVQLVLWHAYREAEREAFDAVLTRFNETHEDITIESLAVPFDAYPDRISAAIPRGRGPDMFIFAHDRVGDWAESSIIEPINFWLNSETLDRFYEPTVRALVYERQLYGIPLAFKSLLLYYNTELVSTPPQTTDDLIALGDELEESMDEEAYALVYEYTNLFFHAPWIHGYGGEVMDESGAIHLSDSPSVDALEFVSRLQEEHQFMPENVFSQSVTSLFNQGRAAMVINGPWFRGELELDSWRVAPLPTVSQSGLAARSFLTVEALMLSTQSTHKTEAVAAMQWLATDSEATQIRANRGHQPVALIEYYEESDVDETLTVFQQQMLHAIPTPNIARMRQVWTHANTALFRAIKNGVDPAVALSEAVERIENGE
jgi:maltose-binding protein MalE